MLREKMNFPAEMMPEGKIYQWICVKVAGEPFSDFYFQRRSEGWTDVPPERHAEFFGECADTKRKWIRVNGNILMENDK